MKRIFITGGSGMLGSYTAAQAVEAGWKTWASYHAHPVNLPVFKQSVDKCRKCV